MMSTRSLEAELASKLCHTHFHAVLPMKYNSVNLLLPVRFQHVNVKPQISMLVSSAPVLKLQYTERNFLRVNPSGDPFKILCREGERERERERGREIKIDRERERERGGDCHKPHMNRDLLR